MNDHYPGPTRYPSGLMLTGHYPSRLPVGREWLNINVVDGKGPGGAHHVYHVVKNDMAETLICEINFQKGGVADNGVNGVTQEALLAIVADRLNAFQLGPFPTQENEAALYHVRQALNALHMRTRERYARGVEGKEQA